MPIIINCANCSRRFSSENRTCPYCDWDPNAKKTDAGVPGPLAETADAVPDASPAMEMVPGPKFEGLRELNVGQLRPMARDLGVTHWYRLGKEKLIAAITSRQNMAKK